MDHQSSKNNFPLVEGIEVTHRFIDIGGIKIHVAEAGEGEPIIMYHGWPQHWYMWKKQIPFFAKHFKVIAADIRGFGWSDAPEKGYTKDELADDLVKLIHALGYKQVRLLSHDWGGWIGFIASAKNPGLITQHFANNIPPVWPKLDLKLIPATIRLWYMLPIAMPFFGQRMLMGSPNYINYLFTRGNTRKEGWTDYEKSVFSDRFKEKDRAYASVKLYRDFLVKEYLPLGLGKYNKYHLKTPSKILFGEKDFAVSHYWLRGYEKYVDDLQIELVPDTGHFIVDEKPDLVNEKALEFFTK
ncbi:MAG TPA: alpha/beta hydrolase [Ignavibacteria bacterium]|nr:alpha/beta hydrolase [Ignavibacteria bacterium]